LGRGSIDPPSAISLIVLVGLTNGLAAAAGDARCLSLEATTAVA
jgi:hypothetical protein